MRRTSTSSLAVAAAFALVAALPGAARAAVTFEPCAQPKGVDCATITVPIDRTGAVPGTLPLLIHRVPASKASAKPPLVVLAGGPGQTNTELTPRFANLYRTIAPDRDLYTFAVRGTGPSRIHCAGFETSTPSGDAVAACGASLGAARNFFTTRDNADDLEAVRLAIGGPKLVVAATSYGTLFAQVYASRHPAGVEALVLDSVVTPEQLDDPFGVQQFKHAPAVAGALCAAHACDGIPGGGGLAQIADVVAQLTAKPVTAPVYDSHGRAHDQVVSGLGTAALIPELDLDGDLRAELLRAVYGASHGDPAPLARLLGPGPTGPPRDTRGEVDATLNTATNCEEYGWPFDRTSAPADRLTEARAAIDRLPESAFAPFGRDIAFAIDQLQQCAYWPMAAARPALVESPLPDVPALIIDGRYDLRTPPVFAAGLAARLKRAQLLTIPFAGHSPLANDTTGCARAAVRAFLANARVRRCRGGSDPFAARAAAPVTLARVKPARAVRGVAGKALTATILTVDDVLDQLDVGTGFRPELSAQVRGGGLRGGRFAGTRAGVRLHRVVFVPGVAFSGVVPRRGTATLVLRGRVRGSLHFGAHGAVNGRIGGVAVAARLALPRQSAFAIAHERLAGLTPAGRG